MTAKFIIGDTRDVTASLPDGSVDLILTSPPFLALRSYLPADHPDKHREIGSEPDPAAFLDVLLDLTVEWRRVLAPHGSICIELGDTYSGARGYGNPDSQNPAYGERSVERWEEARVAKRFKKADDGWPLDKSLCMIPQLYGASLAYGRNLLNGRTIEPWRVRNIVRWCRPNPPVGALGDKFRPATSEMTIACFDEAARPRYFDLEAVRMSAPSTKTNARTAKGVTAKARTGKSADRDGNWDSMPELGQTGTRPPYDHWGLMDDETDLFDDELWLVSTEAYSGSHYATWPRKLLTRPILAMCPQRVCTECGEPSRRIVEKSEEYAAARAAVGDFKADRGRDSGLNGTTQYIGGKHMDRADNVTLGWTDCGHNAWRNGLVLDPFAGSGTTLAVATGHGRDAIGIEIDDRNADLALERVGMFLAVEHHTAEHVA